MQTNNIISARTNGAGQIILNQSFANLSNAAGPNIVFAVGGTSPTALNASPAIANGNIPRSTGISFSADKALITPADFQAGLDGIIYSQAIRQKLFVGNSTDIVVNTAWLTTYKALVFELDAAGQTMLSSIPTLKIAAWTNASKYYSAGIMYSSSASASQTYQLYIFGLLGRSAAVTGGQHISLYQGCGLKVNQPTPGVSAITGQDAMAGSKISISAVYGII